ncbi:MAG: CRISPR-associated helicase Cas3' [Zoogloeaceae bacterium]|jgi:CRISPR-associated endonuclease/helicase Cas3|nr:CRISPR-associated helicase Cas3' [Zoogloeaceae bacterium]
MEENISNWGGSSSAVCFLAHLRQENGKLLPHDLADHQQAVARQAAKFAAVFGAGIWAEWAGIWHDLGKFRAGFQRYIRQCGDPDAHIEGRVAGADKTHSAAGALWAQKYLPEQEPRLGAAFACILSYLIAGHHSGLDNWFDKGLEARFQTDDAQREARDALAADIPDAILRPRLAWPEVGSIKTDNIRKNEVIPGRFALWVRMLFSCLVDADFLDTEAFMSPPKAHTRKGFLSLSKMEDLLTKHLGDMAQQLVQRGEAEQPVNRKRAEVLQACRAKATLTPGVFSLTVPTGGGKTLSSLAFALRHAQLHGKRRVIYAIPYTSIIEQTADVFSAILGKENVIEHHSNAEMDERQETARSRLACENWDAPLVVTTNVQLLESLFARKTSRCRKLHNLAESVIVLDEAQLLPVAYLQPVIDVLRLLVRDYGVSLVLCTATQPTLEARVSFDLAGERGLRGFAPGEVREIVDDVPGLYAALERVRFHLPADCAQPCDWENLADEIMRHDAVLVIVGRRADARDLYQRMKRRDPRNLWHLSGLMCAHHRSDVIRTLKTALSARRQALAAEETPAPIRVISTQLVEAGVDLDFPVVYRALAGLDSLVQAAGRCNREGRLEKGDVYVFVPPQPAPPGLLRMAAEKTRQLWAGLHPEEDPVGVERFAGYFRKLYGDAILDAKGICDMLRVDRRTGAVRFRDAAEAFHLIDNEEGATVFVRYQRDENDDGSEENAGGIDMWLQRLKQQGPERWLMRKLQRYGVTLYRWDIKRLLEQGDIEPLGSDCPGLYVQSEANDLLYDKALGVNVDGVPGDPGALVL